MDDALCWISGATPSAEWLGPRPGREVSGVQRTTAISVYKQLTAEGLIRSSVRADAYVTDTLRQGQPAPIPVGH